MRVEWHAAGPNDGPQDDRFYHLDKFEGTPPIWLGTVS